jgi:glucose-6-phosphate isomerase
MFENDVYDCRTCSLGYSHSMTTLTMMAHQCLFLSLALVSFSTSHAFLPSRTAVKRTSAAHVMTNPTDATDEDYLLQTEDFKRQQRDDEQQQLDDSNTIANSGHYEISLQHQLAMEELLEQEWKGMDIDFEGMLLEQLEADEKANISNLSLPQVHLPPRFVPGVAWKHHHHATLNLIRQHRVRQKQRERKSKAEATVAQDATAASAGIAGDTKEDGGVGSNPVQNFLANFMNRPQLISTSTEWRRLQKHAEYLDTLHLRDLLKDADRCNEMYAVHDGVYLDYSRQRVTQETMKFLTALAEKQNLKGKIDAMVTGEKINFTEERAVLHTALRADRSEVGTVTVDGMDVVQEVHQVLDQIKEFTQGVRSGKIRGYTGKRLRNIVSVGIGGSYLGPEFLHECLKTEPEGINAALGYSLRFLSNVDPVDVERTCADLDPEETLIVIVSKTFTTAETMLNARTMRQWLWDFMGNDKEVVRKHMVACASVSATEQVQDFGIDTENYFFRFWDWVGGRYSVCSAAGAVPISLLYGFDLFEKFLKGANSIDKHFVSAPFEQNIPVLMGLLGVWNMSFMKYQTRTTLPYAEALLKLPAHIQQLDMESNGKSMTKQGTYYCVLGDPLKC